MVLLFERLLKYNLPDRVVLTRKRDIRKDKFVYHV